MSPEWHFLITLNEYLRPLKDPVAVQEVAVRLISGHLHASRVNFAHIDGDEFVVNRSYPDGVPRVAARGSVGRFGRPIVDAWRRGETVAVDNVETDPRFTDAERKQLLAGDAAAFVARR
jgi:GAF domain-containing protein